MGILVDASRIMNLTSHPKKPSWPFVSLGLGFIFLLGPVWSFLFVYLGFDLSALMTSRLAPDDSIVLHSIGGILLFMLGLAVMLPGVIYFAKTHELNLQKRVKAEKELQANQEEIQQGRKLRSLGEMASGVAHEFNNLLTPVLIELDLIAQRHRQDMELQKNLLLVRDAVLQMSDLTEQFLSLGRKSSRTSEPVQLSNLAENACAFFGKTIDRRIELTCLGDTHLPPLVLPKASVFQIILNLCYNARDAVLDKALTLKSTNYIPKIVVETRRHEKIKYPSGTFGAAQELQVYDNGLGMTPDVQKRLFEPFFTTKLSGKGMGLGLAVVWNALDSMGGWIDVETINNEGSTFRLFFPETGSILTTNIPEQLSATHFQKSLAPRNILLIEDNPNVALAFIGLLEEAGHTVVHASDGQQALDLVDQNDGSPLNFIITDINLPKVSGIDVIRRIKSSGRLPSIPIIFVSGLITDNQRDELNKLGITDILTKPVSAAHLLMGIESATATQSDKLNSKTPDAVLD